jgi:hypothetical protein
MLSQSRGSMSRRSPDGAQRNPGMSRLLKRRPRITQGLHPGYVSEDFDIFSYFY